MKIDKNTSFKDFLFYVNLFHLSEQQMVAGLSKLKEVKPPASMGGKPVPDSLNNLTFGQLISLQDAKTPEDMLFAPMKFILGIERTDVLSETAFDVITFMLFVQKELVRIGKMFDRIRYRPSAQEIEAGIDQLSHGLFGTIDWYARRMGITDHEQVENVKWLRIYKCMEIDSENTKFEKRLREIMSKKK